VGAGRGDGYGTLRITMTHIERLKAMRKMSTSRAHMWGTSLVTAIDPATCDLPSLALAFADQCSNRPHTISIYIPASLIIGPSCADPRSIRILNMRRAHVHPRSTLYVFGLIILHNPTPRANFLLASEESNHTTLYSVVNVLVNMTICN
jgi:hypothetical protein